MDGNLSSGLSKHCLNKWTLVPLQGKDLLGWAATGVARLSGLWRKTYCSLLLASRSWVCLKIDIWTTPKMTFFLSPFDKPEKATTTPMSLYLVHVRMGAGSTMHTQTWCTLLGRRLWKAKVPVELSNLSEHI